MKLHTAPRSETQYQQFFQKYPYMREEVNPNCGRIDLPVSPVCNIQCHFCKRGLNKEQNQSNSVILRPDQASRVLDDALALWPEIITVGIAGPGDTLASPHALETFRLVHSKYPKLGKCLNTNGLLLREKAEALAEAGVNMISVNMNAVNVGILAQICSYVLHDNKYMTGEIAARWLILAQVAGIRVTADLGIAVKINTVLIPGVNDHHISEVARVAAQVGARFMNIMPLVPQHKFSDRRSPTDQELNAAKMAAERYLPCCCHSSTPGGMLKTSG
ncbi:MAG: nifB 1 [Anaerosporomusa subterranea]|nr:nifB 1 [Anaerosporomusa subterranea]